MRRSDGCNREKCAVTLFMLFALAFLLLPSAFPMPISLALHGGAGTIPRGSLSPEKEASYTNALKVALEAGWQILKSGGSALDAVEATVVSLEDTPLFNAGRGAVFTHDGTHELDASIMRGDTRDAGAIAGVQGVRNPISLARQVMEQSPHVLLAGRGAEAFAKQMGARFEDADYFYDAFRYGQLQEARTAGRVQLDHAGDDTPTQENSVTAPDEKKFGTVGAVALDSHGLLAAATSTGGMTNKKWGRLGDSPIIGAGTWADNRTCAISCTGDGEYFIRAVAAHEVHALMRHGGLSLQQACDVVVMRDLVEIGGEGGLVAVDSAGNVCLPFNSEGMYRAWRKEDGEEGVAIYR